MLVFWHFHGGLRADANYLKEIKPLLRERCYSCHGALKQKAQLRIDTVEGMLQGGKSGAAIHRGDAVKSLLVQRVSAHDLAERMPPEHEGEPLSAAQLKLLHDWISAGAPAPDGELPEADPKEHWAFRPRVRPRVPKVVHATWVRNPLDAFIAEKHEQHGLTPQGEAPAAIQLRRLHFDLIGLPPTEAEMVAYERNPAPDRYERTVDRLLDDPRHGERWARHWMDIWRYSDWWGLGEQLRNSQKHIWHWRDWIIESLNADTPYDEIVRLMLAADESHPGDLQKLRATGFLARNYFLFNRNQWMEETVEHVGKGFLGLTFNCAKCHDHKYDPIAQADFYRLRAFFEPYHVRLDLSPGEADLDRDGIPRVYDGWPDRPTYRFVRGQENAPDKSEIIGPGVPEALAFGPGAIHPITLPLEAWQPERRPWVMDAHLTSARRRFASAAAAAVRVRATSASGESPNAAALGELNVAELAASVAESELRSVEYRAEAMRASWLRAEGEGKSAAAVEAARQTAWSAAQAEREVLLAKARHTVLDAELRLLRAAADKKDGVEKELKTSREALEKVIKEIANPGASEDSYTRLAGAKWTPTRFLSSEKDDPAVEFISTSTGRRTALAAWITDPRNPLTARVAVNHLWARHLGTPLVATVFDFGRKGGNPSHPELLDWLAAELVDSGWSMKHLHRLIVTSATYRMGSSVAGAAANVALDPDNHHHWRRAPIRLEAQVVRDAVLALSGVLDPAMGGPSVPPSSQADSRRRSLYFFHSNNERNLFLTTFDDAGVKECYRREQSIVPQQALALANSALVQDAARRMAERLSQGGPMEDSTFIRRAFIVVLGVVASETEMDSCRHALAEWRRIPAPTAAENPVDAARANLIWALFNHNDFVTLR